MMVSSAAMIGQRELEPEDREQPERQNHVVEQRQARRRGRTASSNRNQM